MDCSCAPILRFSLWCQMAPQQSAKFRTVFYGHVFPNLRKDSVANYAWIWTLFSPSVTGPDVLYLAFRSSAGRWRHKIRQICCRNFPKRKKLAAELCQILRMGTIELVINSICLMSIHVTLHPILPVCIVLDGTMLLFLVSYAMSLF